MGKPKFTIAIPVHNGERFLAAAIESAVAQSRPADEVLVVDDNSSDATRAIATDTKWRGQVRYVFNARATGFADAFNRAARLAASEFVAFLSSDDTLDPNFLSSVESLLLAYPQAKFCYVASRYIDADGKPLSGCRPNCSSPPRLYDGRTYLRNYLTGCLNHSEIHRCAGVVVERKLFIEECPFRKEAGILADNDFFIRIAARTDVVGISEPLASVRVHKDSISSRMESLSLRVSKDYLYQVRFLRTHPECIAEEDACLVYSLAFRHLSSLFVEALWRGRPDLYSAGTRILQDLVAAIGPEASRKSIAGTGRALHVISHSRWARHLYGVAVRAAAAARRLKRMSLKTFMPEQANREHSESPRLWEL